MGRELGLYVSQRFPLSCASSRRQTYGRKCLSKTGLQHNALQKQLLERCVPQGRTFFNRELHDHVAELVRKNRFVSVVPAVWMMGGGPRTYPGGVKKWQWKRRQRKDDWELEKHRFARERKLFETRRRQELREASPRVASTLDGLVKSSALGGMMVATGHGHASLLAPDTLPREAELNSSMAVIEDSVKASKGMQVSATVHEGWTGSRKEVAEQILKVQDRVRNKNRRLPVNSHSEITTSFGELSLSPLSTKALNFILDIHNMTPLQEATLPLILEGCDLLARTKVSGEDVIASLLRAIELIINRTEELPMSEIARMQQCMTVSGRSPITVLLVCPTQERAAFVASDARLLLMFHSTIRVQVVKGGNDIRKETRNLQRLPCEIVVATPGRLLNQLQRSPEFRGQLSGLKLFVLHEVQKLLDMGYRRTIERISHLVSQSRQTLLWSSSQTAEVLSLAQTLMKKDHKVINSYGAEEDEVAYRMVRQDFLIVPIELHLAVLYSLLKVHVEQNPNYKVVVFCQTVRTSTFMKEVFRNLGFHTCEVHMRKNEKYRERVAAEFRTAQGGLILFTCGASVWGVSDPDVTLVLQIGPPSGREQYVQRVSLSGQEIKKRECILLLMPHQQSFLDELPTIPLWEITLPEINPDTRAQVQQAVQQVHSQIRIKAYVAWLRYYISKNVSFSAKQEAIQLASIYSSVLGFHRPPQLNAQTNKALGLDEIDHRGSSPMRGK